MRYNELGAMHVLRKRSEIQLIEPSATGYILPAVTIHDHPRFRWRGLMIDCGRHFEPVAVLKRNLDGMAAVKLNVFHWHPPGGGPGDSASRARPIPI